MTTKETTLKEIGETLTYVVEHMTTKEELAELRREMVTKDEFNSFRNETAENFRAIRAELADIRRDLDELRMRVDNMSGYSKEIDHALARISRIEKHLGIDMKAAA